MYDDLEINATIDAEVRNIESLLVNLQFLRNQWKAIYNECKVAAEDLEHVETILASAKNTHETTNLKMWMKIAAKKKLNSKDIVLISTAVP